jgi:hypothetical protein
MPDWRKSELEENDAIVVKIKRMDASETIKGTVKLPYEEKNKY